MKKNNSGYSINITTNTITVTAQFAKEASKKGTDAYKVYKALIKDFPYMEVVQRAPRKASKKALVNYKKMEAYIDCLDNSPKYFAMFDLVKRLSKSSNSPAAFTKKWFFATFPDFAKCPEFDQNGNLAITINEAAGNALIEEMSAAA